MAGAADALQGDGNRARRADLADQVHGADVDAEFERGGGDQHAHFAGLELALGGEPQLAREAAVVRGDGIRAEALAKMMRDAFGQAPRVDEDQRRAMLASEFRDAVVNLAPHFVRGDGAEFARGNFDGQIQRTAVADVDDDRRGAIAAGKELRDQLDGLLRGGKTDAHRRAIEQGFEAFERERQMRAALIVGDGVNFVDDHGFHAAQDGAAFFRRQQDVERFGRGDQDVRRTREHGAALVHQRVAGANSRRESRGISRPRSAGHLQNFAERNFQIFLDVVAEGLERRNIKDFGAIVERAAEGLAHQAVDAGEKRRQRLARTGWRGDDVACRARMCGQPSSCGSVGDEKRWRNHSRTIGCAQSREFETEAPLSSGFVPGSTAGIL